MQAGELKKEEDSKFVRDAIVAPLVGAFFGVVLNVLLRWTVSGAFFPPISPLVFAAFKYGSIVSLALFGFIFGAMLYVREVPPLFSNAASSHPTLLAAIKGIFIVLVAVIVIVAALFIFFFTPSPIISISSPTSGSTVQQNVIVYGTANYVPSGQSLWLVLYNPQLRLYYPQDPAVTIQPNGKWSGQMYVGGANDTGKQFTISAVLADNGVFASYVRNGETTGNWPGIIPENYTSIVNTYDQVTVTRV
jgi:hypothetical protein